MSDLLIFILIMVAPYPILLLTIMFEKGEGENER